MTDVTELTTAQTGIRRRVESIGAGQWDLPTPCTDWDVSKLVQHMIGGSRMALLLLQGASGEESLAPFDLAYGPDLVTELDVALSDELAAFAAPDSFELVVHHPMAGDVPGQTLYQFRTSDYLLHSWDLARATGGDESLDQALVLLAWEGLQPMAPFIGEIGVFGTGPSGTVADDAPVQQRLLDLTGRRP